MSKRGHDAGTIYDRKNRLGKVISYQAQLSLPGGDRRTKTFKTRREAQRWLTETQAAVLHGHLLPSRSQRLSEYLEGWLETKRQTIKPLTYNAYDLNVRRIQPHLGHIRLDALKPAHVQDAYNQLSAKGMAPRTVRQVHLTLHKALKDAIQLDLIGRNVTEGVMLPRLPHSERPWYTLEELDRLFQATSGDRFHALWVVLGTCGLRLGEAMGLMWGDIDLDRRTLTVRRTLQRQSKGSGLVFAEPKSKRSRRTIELSKEACLAFKLHQERQAFERKKADETWKEQGLVFTSVIGTPLEYGRIYKHWKTAVEKAEIPLHRIHDLRHTVATHLTMAGMGAREVAEVLGHSNASLVLEVYGHVAPTTHRKAADLMDKLLAEQREAT